MSSSMEDKGSTDQIITITYALGQGRAVPRKLYGLVFLPDAVSVRSLSLRSHLHQIWQRKAWKILTPLRGRGQIRTRHTQESDHDGHALRL